MVLPPSGTNGYRFDDKGEKVYDYVDGRTIDNPKVAKALLPTQEGFFFGSQDYDQWYLEDLEETAAVLKTELAIGTATDHYAGPAAVIIGGVAVN
jgi:hypothetical protein